MRVFGKRVDQADRELAERAIVDARLPEPTEPEDPPQWEAVSGEAWGDAVTEVITRIKDEETDVERLQNVRRVVAEDDNAVVSVEAGAHNLPASLRELRITCHECEGAGYVVRSVSDLLKESLRLIPAGQEDSVIVEFYRRLRAADNGKSPADQLTSLFPPDLITAAAKETDSRGASQRDKLLNVLLALADLYRPEDEAAMEKLDNALKAYGRSHALFIRPDGSVRGATLQEYAQVEMVLLGTFHDVAGDSWRPQYDVAWTEAYDYAAPVMLVEAHRAVLSGEFTMPRMPREARPVTEAGG